MIENAGVTGRTGEWGVLYIYKRIGPLGSLAYLVAGTVLKFETPAEKIYVEKSS